MYWLPIQFITAAATSRKEGTTRNLRVVSASERRVVCYWGSWSIYRPGDGKFEVANIDPNICTHIIYAFAGLNAETNKIMSLDTWNDLPGNLDSFGKFTRLAKSHSNLKALLAIGGWNEGSIKYSNMVSSYSARATFIQSAVSFVREHDFDGLDLDWEYPANRGGKPEDRENFSLLLEEMRQVTQLFNSNTFSKI